MCVECRYGKATGPRLYWNALKYWWYKASGLFHLEGLNMTMIMSLPEPWTSQAQKETNAEAAKHDPKWKMTWAAQLYMYKTLSRYCREAGVAVPPLR